MNPMATFSIPEFTRRKKWLEIEYCPVETFYALK
jgi:hypothetical protein